MGNATHNKAIKFAPVDRSHARAVYGYVMCTRKVMELPSYEKDYLELDN